MWDTTHFKTQISHNLICRLGSLILGEKFCPIELTLSAMKGEAILAFLNFFLAFLKSLNWTSSIWVGVNKGDLFARLITTEVLVLHGAPFYYKSSVGNPFDKSVDIQINFVPANPAGTEPRAPPARPPPKARGGTTFFSVFLMMKGVFLTAFGESVQ